MVGIIFNRTFLPTILFMFLLQGCGAVINSAVDRLDCEPNEYIVPDAHEFTFGATYADKYWNKTFGVGKCVKVTGGAVGLIPATIDDTKYIMLKLKVEGGVGPIGVYAPIEYGERLRGLRQNQVVTVSGRVLTMKNKLGIFLHHIE